MNNQELKDKVENDWQNLWKDICTTENGELDMENIKNELYDYHFLMNQASELYDYISNGKLCKTNYFASVLKSQHDDRIKEALEEQKEDILDILKAYSVEDISQDIIKEIENL